MRSLFAIAFAATLYGAEPKPADPRLAYMAALLDHGAVLVKWESMLTDEQKKTAAALTQATKAADEAKAKLVATCPSKEIDFSNPELACKPAPEAKK
jgi:hypothetical protein